MKVISHTQEAHFSGRQNVGGQVRLKDLREGKSMCGVIERAERDSCNHSPVMDMA